jgi:hypothetical protein
MRAYTVAVISVVALVAAANGSKIVSNEVRRNEMLWPRVAGSGGPRIDRPFPAGQTCQCLTDAYAINLSSHFFHLLS